MADDIPAPELATEPPPVADVPTASEPASDVSESKPKRKGRPPGSKDTVKRIRNKPSVQVRIEPINEAAIEPKPEHKTEHKPEHTPEPKHEIVEPLTPKTMLIEASRHYLSLRNIVRDNAKADMYNMYTKKLTSWPV